MESTLMESESSVEAEGPDGDQGLGGESEGEEDAGEEPVEQDTQWWTEDELKAPDSSGWGRGTMEELAMRREELGLREYEEESGEGHEAAIFSGESQATDDSSVLERLPLPVEKLHSSLFTDEGSSYEDFADQDHPPVASTGGPQQRAVEDEDDWSDGVSEKPATVKLIHTAVVKAAADPAPEAGAEESSEESEAEEDVGQWDVVTLRKVPSPRSDGYTLHHNGYSYSLYRKKNLPIGTALRDFVQTWRCSRHGSGPKCDLRIRVNGLNQVVPEDVPKLSQHQCVRDIGVVYKQQMLSKLRQQVRDAMGMGKFSKWKDEAMIVMRQYSYEKQKAARFFLHDANRYCNDFAKTERHLTPLPKDSWDWDFDETSDVLFLRDPSHSEQFMVAGDEAPKVNPETGELGFKLYDKKFEFDVKERGVVKTVKGRVIVLGNPQLLRKWAVEAEGACLDGTYYSCPRPFAQLFNCVLQVPVQRDEHNAVNKVAHLPVFHALLTSHHEEVYMVLFRWLKEFVPNLAFKYVMADLELAAVKAFRNVFSGTVRQNCGFHAGRCVRGLLVKHRVFNTLVGHQNGIFRRWLRFLVALQFLKSRHIAPVYERFKEAIESYDSHPEEKAIFQSKLLPYMDKLFYGGVDKFGKKIKPRFEASAVSRHRGVLAGWIRDSNSVEAYHSTLNKNTGPHPTIYTFCEVLFYMMEMAASRAAVLEKLQEDEELLMEEERMDDYLIGFSLDDSSSQLDKSVLAKRSGKEEMGKTGTAYGIGSSSASRSVRYVNENSAAFLKRNPFAKDFKVNRLGSVVGVDSSGYFPMKVAGEKMDKGFPSIADGVRCYPAYEDCLGFEEETDIEPAAKKLAVSLLYLWVRKMSHHVTLFGHPKPFVMSEKEKAVFSNFDTYDVTDGHFCPEGQPEEGIGEEESDVEEDVSNADDEMRLNSFQAAEVDVDENTKVAEASSSKGHPSKAKAKKSAEASPSKGQPRKDKAKKDAEAGSSKGKPRKDKAKKDGKKKFWKVPGDAKTDDPLADVSDDEEAPAKVVKATKKRPSSGKKAADSPVKKFPLKVPAVVSKTPVKVASGKADSVVSKAVLLAKPKKSAQPAPLKESIVDVNMPSVSPLSTNQSFDLQPPYAMFPGQVWPPPDSASPSLSSLSASPALASPTYSSTPKGVKVKPNIRPPSENSKTSSKPKKSVTPKTPAEAEEGGGVKDKSKLLSETPTRSGLLMKKKLDVVASPSAGSALRRSFSMPISPAVSVPVSPSKSHKCRGIRPKIPKSFVPRPSPPLLRSSSLNNPTTHMQL